MRLFRQKKKNNKKKRLTNAEISIRNMNLTEEMCNIPGTSLRFLPVTLFLFGFFIRINAKILIENENQKTI